MIHVEVNQIRITPHISIPKGNFDFVLEATHNDQMYLGCLEAEKHMMTDYDACLIGIRRAMEMLGIELEKESRAETYNITSQEALRSIFIDLKRIKNSRNGLKDRRRISKKNFYLRHVVDFAKKDHEDYTRQQIRDFIRDYAKVYPYEYLDDRHTNKSMKGIAYDMYVRCSRPLKDKGCGTKEDSAALLRLFHRMLCLLNYVQEQFDYELVPFEDYYPIPLEYYDELEFVKGSNFGMYVSGDGKTFYMLKRKDMEYLDVLDSIIYKQRLRELERIEILWDRLSEMAGYKPCRVEEIGTSDYRRLVLEFEGKPHALTQNVIDRIDRGGMKEELIRSIMRMIRCMHEGNPSIAHMSLNPEYIYVCVKVDIILTYVVDFDISRILNVRNRYPGRDLIEDHFNAVDLKKFVAPELINSPRKIPDDPCAADIYSLGKLVKYVYGKNEKKVRDYVERLIKKDPEGRPSIAEAGRAFDDEVVYFEPTVTLGLEVMDEFRLLVFTQFSGFFNYSVSDTVTVGRMFSSDGKEIKIDSPIASRTHGKFVKTDTGFEYSDMLSTNGTFINGVLYGAPRHGRTEPKALKFGDILKIDTPELKRAHKNAVYMFVLAPSYHEMRQYTIEIVEGLDVCIGREEGDVILANNRVSKKHARFVVKNGNLYVQDLKSTNGLYVNGKMIDHPVRLYPMDSVRIEDYVFVVTEKKIYYCAE